jgi:2-iminobutanoate/2-iminopropanoate deaminase
MTHLRLYETPNLGVHQTGSSSVWRARREFFSGDFPCSTLIEVKRVGSPKASPPLKVEINATGVIGAGG